MKNKPSEKRKIIISIKNLSKVYKLYDKNTDRMKEALHPLKKKLHRNFYALKDINIEVKKGEILGIVGRNGAGKSTLLKIICRIISPNEGECLFYIDLATYREIKFDIYGK